MKATPNFEADNELKSTLEILFWNVKNAFPNNQHHAITKIPPLPQKQNGMRISNTWSSKRDRTSAQF